MRVIVAGCRGPLTIEQRATVREELFTMAVEWSPTVVIHGGATGVDAVADQWARERGLEVEVYPADWERYGRAAGPKRNDVMAIMGDRLIAFPSTKSRGTWHMWGCMAEKPRRLRKI